MCRCHVPLRNSINSVAHPRLPSADSVNSYFMDRLRENENDAIVERIPKGLSRTGLEGAYGTVVDSALFSSRVFHRELFVAEVFVSSWRWRRAFEVWNCVWSLELDCHPSPVSLSSELRQCHSLGEFKRLLKTHLFGEHGTLWHFSQERRLEIILLTYLLTYSSLKHQSLHEKIIS